MIRLVKALGKVCGTRGYAVFVLCAITAMSLSAQTFKSLVSFDFTDGAGPQAGLVQATNGDLYGTTHGGGLNSSGTVFKITTRGALTTVYNFCSLTNCADGEYPNALVQATNGYLYGTTQQGGMHGEGSIFRITLSGSLTTLYSFCSLTGPTGCTDGANPLAGLIQDTNGDFYGTTAGGGSGAPASGTVFKMTPGGKLTTLYSFCSQSLCTDGSEPLAGLNRATNFKDFYGTTIAGGAHGEGTVFRITPGGTLTTLHSFCSKTNCADGSNPEAGLVPFTNGGFYGTTTYGGANSNGGTVFQITSGGRLTTLYSFCAQTPCTDGYNPAGLIQATDGTLYGVTTSGGDTMDPSGTIFEIAPDRPLRTLYAFSTEGAQPFAALVQDTNGELYGTTIYGGASTACVNGCGTVFGLSVGLSPFVTTLPTASLVGAAVKILGSDLTGATSVTFNGTAAVFTVVSSAEITTTVPAGATAGTVEVVTPSGALTSNVSFQVLP